jgi:hypothetical protein
MWKRLFHRWFIEYNPLYLLSAALVLRGVNLLSHGLASAGHVYAEIGVPAVAEAYAWALIAGAALLTRTGLRRPGVMVALLAVLYQGDLTLHTETCAYLGAAGWVASGVWLASFVLKLRALAWAVRLRGSRSAFFVPTFGALGLVVVPRWVQHLDAHAASALVALWLFAVFASHMWTACRVDSAVTLDDWGKTVLRRSLAATWILWGSLALLHVAFWLSSRRAEPSVLMVLPALLAAPRMKRESHAWGAVLGTLAVTLAASPGFFGLAAFLSSVVLAKRAFDAVRTGQRASTLGVGVLACAYLTVWSFGPFPDHMLWLDGVFASSLVLAAWRLRAYIGLLPLGATLAHHAVRASILTVPVSTLEWGTWSVVVGFVLLGATIGASVVYQVKHRMREPDLGP